MPLPSTKIKALQGHKNKSKEEQVMVIAEALLKPEKLDKEEDKANTNTRSIKSRKKCKWKDLTKEQVKKVIVNIVAKAPRKDKITIEVLEILKPDWGKVTRLVNKDLCIGRASIKRQNLCSFPSKAKMQAQ